MNMPELKTGMRVVHKNGKIGIIFADMGIIGYKGGYNLVNSLNTNLQDRDGESEWDVDKVYGGYVYHSGLLDLSQLGSLVWDRYDTATAKINELEATIKQAQEQLEELKKELK